MSWEPWALDVYHVLENAYYMVAEVGASTSSKTKKQIIEKL
jgi:hypothetical protein